MRLSVRNALPVAVTLVLAAGEAHAQKPAEIVLQPEARLSEPFTRVRGLRELSDGRVLVSDQTENGVFVSDFRTQTRTRIGGNGAGPEEYRTPIHLFAVRADTTLLLDLGNMRLATIAPDGRIVATRGALDAPGASIPTHADSAGRLYWDLTQQVRIAKRENPRADQAALIRASGNVHDTIGHITIPGGANPGPFPDWDYWATSGDGRIAIVRNTGEYRLDWIDADGTLHRGQPVDEDGLRVNRSDRETFEKPRDEGGMGGGNTAGVRLGGRNSSAPRPSRQTLPDVLPWAKYGGVWVAPDGRAWVERLQHFDEKRPLLDVFDAAGRLALRYRLPADRQLVGLGNGTLYAVRTDEDGLQWLERYSLKR